MADYAECQEQQTNIEGYEACRGHSDETKPIASLCNETYFEAALEPSAPPLETESDGISESQQNAESVLSDPAAEEAVAESQENDNNPPPHVPRHVFDSPPSESIVFASDQPKPTVIPPRVVKSFPPTIFGYIAERCVTFCIDTSGSMFDKIHVVKEHLMELLTILSTREGQMFNMIEFNSQVTQWADKMVECTPQTVAVAKDWVNNLSAKSGTNMQDALVTAFADPACQAVYLVSDGLPDQYAEEVLDRVVGTCGNRSVHCIYIAGAIADEATTEFLEDLAVETFGSFHIVTLTTHGMLERITPVYRSDHAHERIVHTVNNTIRPNIKTCSVATTLQIDPEEVLGMAPRVGVVLPSNAPYVGHNGLVTTAPHRYYYPHYWSRYRPAKAWLRAQDMLENPAENLGLSPAAGSLLVGKKVIARRIEDGYFYKATVQSQNLGEKFLVAFGPCKHGKYGQVSYQDTHVFDIVDYHDALRHTIINGDRVLAPWEPEGERFCAGIVIEGQERRHADGPDDQDLTVSFCNGQTVTVPRNLAVWIPPSVYERLSLELKMPSDARKSLLSSVDQYPLENLPGYPVSGPKADPVEYAKAGPLVLDSDPYLWDPYLFQYPPHIPAYYGYPPFVVSKHSLREKETLARDVQARKTDDPLSLIPGTDMTKQELDSRIMSQLMEHRLSGTKAKVEAKRAEESKERSEPKLLGRREKVEENHLKKSVSFSDINSFRKITPREVEEEAVYYDEDDSIVYDEYGNLMTRADCSTNTDSSLLFYRSPGIKGRPRWRYWSNDSSPGVCDISDGRKGNAPRTTGQSQGPFRETALQAPLEARDQRQPPYNVEWTSPAFKFVDTFAKHDYSTSVEDCLHPKPPSKPSKYPTYNYTPACKTFAAMTSEEREEARRAHRRRRVIKREEARQERVVNEDNMKACMQDQHRERVAAMMDRDRQRQMKEQEDIWRAREAKKKISSELRARIEQNQRDEMDKENNRIDGLRRRRERREQIQVIKEREVQETVTRREEIRKQNSEGRLRTWTEQLDKQGEKASVVDKRHQEAKMRRIKHFQDLERKGQEQKDRRLAVKDQGQAIFMSQIFA